MFFLTFLWGWLKQKKRVLFIIPKNESKHTFGILNMSARVIRVCGLSDIQTSIIKNIEEEEEEEKEMLFPH